MRAGSSSTGEQQLTVWLEELETTAGRFQLVRSLDDLAEVRRTDALPQGIAIARGAETAQPTVALFLETLRSCLPEGLITIVSPSLNDVSGIAALLFVETLEFGSIRRDVMRKLVELAHVYPLVLLLVTIPRRPPSTQAAVLVEYRAKLQAERIPLLHLAVCDPEVPATIEESARRLVASLKSRQMRRLRDRLLRVNRALIINLRTAETSTRLDLQSIETKIRELEHDKEIAEGRLARALEAMRARLDSELPAIAPQILDRVQERSGALADAVMSSEELFAATLERITADAVDSILAEMLPSIAAEAVVIFSEAAAEEASAVVSGARTEAAKLSAESHALATELGADAVVPIMRWHGLIGKVFGPLIQQVPQLAMADLVLGAATKLYIAKQISDVIDELHEPLQRNLAALAAVLAERTREILLRIAREPIDALEPALQAERRRHLAARGSAIPLDDLAAARKHHEKLAEVMQEWNDA
jgi:hypothetical protein